MNLYLMIFMRPMTDTVLDLPDTKLDNKSDKSETNTDKSTINQNKSDKPDLTDLKDLKIPKQRKERNDKGRKHIFKNKKKEMTKIEPDNSTNHITHQSRKPNIPIWIVGIVVIFAIGIFFVKYKMPSTQNQRSIFQ